MSWPPELGKQTINDNNLRGFLLKNVNSQTQHPHEKLLNQFLENRVNMFFTSVVEPLRTMNHFNQDKIQWYFAIYKEGLEAYKVQANPFTFLNVSRDQINEIVLFLKDKDLLALCELGASFLTNAYTALTGYFRDQLVLVRLDTIYKSDKPVDWILIAEKEEDGLMKQNVDTVPEVHDVIQKITFLMNKRV